jgi:hypothetical protein
MIRETIMLHEELMRLNDGPGIDRGGMRAYTSTSQQQNTLRAAARG